MLPAGATAKIGIDHKDLGSLVLRLIEGVLAGILGAVVGKHVLAQAVEGDALQKAGRDNPIGVDVVAQQGDPSACDGQNFA